MSESNIPNMGSGAVISNSPPFTISRYNEDEKANIAVEFLLENGRPVRLGDGSFGSIYKGRNLATEEKVAIKLLYENKSMNIRQLGELKLDEKNWILDSLQNDKLLTNLESENKIDEFRAFFINHSGSNFELIRSFQELFNEKTNYAKVEDLISFVERVNDVVGSTAIYRFQRERIVSGKLLNSSERRVRSHELRGLVRVLGGAENFKEVLGSDGFENLANYFSEESINISNYVLVMDQYDYSLKDLLERPINNGRNGYEILKHLTNDARIREALLILDDVSYGLYQLHNVLKEDGEIVHYFHRDIKPGNIFIKEVPVNRISVALGDLGNLPPSLNSMGEMQNGSMFELGELDFAPGTHHYRSPEQKYIMDVANVRVLHLDDYEVEELLTGEGQLPNAVEPEIGDENERKVDVLEEQYAPKQEERKKESRSGKKVVLLVEDPKFSNTLIEKGDIAIFSKDATREEHLIVKCVSDVQDKWFVFVLSDAVSESGILAEDEKTQVEFFKKQEFRTDLFGIGAIAFDIVTAGSSPEKFYENIRKFESGNVKSLCDRYSTLRKGAIEADNPDLAQIFQPFRNQGDPEDRYPDEAVVEFILKCMLYQSEGTFYNEHKDNPEKASEAVNKMVGHLKKVFDKKFNTLGPYESILKNEDKIERRHLNNQSQIQFDHIIRQLQGLANWPEIDSKGDPRLKGINQLLFGSYYFTKTIDLVFSNTNNYFQQILPAYVTYFEKKGKGEFELDPLQVWHSREEIKSNLIDNRLERLVRSAKNPFVPNSLAGSMREIVLFRVEDYSDFSQEHRAVACGYRFKDASFLRSEVSIGDLVICQRKLWEIIDKKEEYLILEMQIQEGESDTKISWPNVGYEEATIFSDLNPIKYYLDMLGVYLLHLVFVYSPFTTTTPDRLDVKSLLDVLEVGPKIYLSNPDSKNANNKIQEILAKYVLLYLKLTLHDSIDSYYYLYSNSDISDVGALLIPVKEFAEARYKQVIKLLGLEGKVFGSNKPEPISVIENLTEDMRDMVDELIDNRFDIEMTIKRSGIVAWQ